MGTTRYHMIMPPYKATDGVMRMAELCKANWLITDIAAFMIDDALAKAPFIVWNLTVEDKHAVLEADDGDGTVIFSRSYDYTDFPLDEMKLYCTNNVLLLPSEY